MAKKFIWLLSSQLDANRKLLEKGQVYKASDFPSAEHWVKEKAAKWVEEKSKTKEKK